MMNVNKFLPAFSFFSPSVEKEEPKQSQSILSAAAPYLATTIGLQVATTAILTIRAPESHLFFLAGVVGNLSCFLFFVITVTMLCCSTGESFEQNIGKVLFAFSSVCLVSTLWSVDILVPYVHVPDLLFSRLFCN